MRFPQLRIGSGPASAGLSSAFLGLLVGSCAFGDGILRPGPTASIVVHTVFAGVGSPRAAAPSPVDRVRVLAIRPSSGETLDQADATVTPGQQSVPIELSVELEESPEQLLIRVELWAAEVLAYRGETLMLVDASKSVNESPPVVLEPASPSLAVQPVSVDFTLPRGGSTASQTITLTNVGVGVLSWQVSSDASWLSTSLTSGTLPSGGAAAVLVQVSSIGLEPGTHTGTLTFTAPGALGSPRSVAVSLAVEANQPPVADAGLDRTVSDGDGSGSEPVTLDGTGSSDPDGSVVSWVWTEGGATLATGPTPTVALAVGTHAVTLTVTDNDGAIDTDQVQIIVLARPNEAPVADAGPNRTVTDADDSGSEPVTLDGTGSSDPDGSVVSWVWTEGGAPLATGPTPTVVFAVGTHVVTLTVTDDDGATDTDQVQITVLAPAPADLIIPTGAPTVTPGSVAAGGSVTLSSWQVHNKGGTASGPFSNGFYLSTDAVIDAGDVYLDGNSNASLAPGEGFTWSGPTLTIPTSTAPGTYYVGILVDRADQVPESNEGNNAVATRVTVTSGEVTLTVVVDGIGLVTSSGVTPAIDCYADICSATYPIGTKVPLTASNTHPDFSFERWLGTGSGFTCTTSPTCTVTMDQDRTVTAWYPAPGMLSVDPSTATFTMPQGGTPTPSSRTVTVSNIGDRPVTGVSIKNVPAWLSAIIDRTVIDTLTPGTMTLAVNPNTLDPGTYSASVYVGDFVMTVATVDVTLTVEESRLTISNYAAKLVELNSPRCPNNWSLFDHTVDYSDSGGTVTAAKSVVDGTWTLQPSGESGTFSGHPSSTTGPSVGVATFHICAWFGANTSQLYTVTLTDDQGRVSNVLSLEVKKPAGAG